MFLCANYSWEPHAMGRITIVCVAVLHVSSQYQNYNPLITSIILWQYLYKKKTWKGKMIKNILKLRKESDTYLTRVCKHRWSRQITIKEDEN